MHYLGAAHQLVQAQAHFRVQRLVCLNLAQTLLFLIPCIAFVSPARAQDNGSQVTEYYGKGAEITVTVYDSSGEPISSSSTVKLYRDGTILSRQGQTSRGSALLVVNTIGEFSIVVEAAGYETARRELSVQSSGREQVDIYLRRLSSPATVTTVPGSPLLAPKAKQALDKGLQALSEDHTKDAEKYVAEAIRLAPADPDVLYVQGVLLLKQRNWPEAQTALAKATQIDPNHARALAALGMALCNQGKYDSAIEPLEKSVQLTSAGAWETRWILAKAYYHYEKYDEAVKMSQDALAASHGKAPEIALLVAQSLTAVGRYEDAAQTLREFVKDYGDRREAETARRWLERLTANGKIQARSN
jgi:Tfp pilus assembly protein PilF